VKAASVIPLARPYVGDEELEELRQVLESGQLGQGPKVAELEAQVADVVGARHAIATTSCTTALHLSLVALDIRPGDEVLVPDFTFPATANVVVQQGATPVLVDIDPHTYNLDTDHLASLVTPRTRAVIPVHLFGLSADMGPVLKIAGDNGLAVIEDAACALGATYHGAPCGSFGDLACFSFHPRKIITTGEGGMVVTDRDDLAERLRLLRNHGGVPLQYWSSFEAAGFNYRMSDLQAAVGVVQARRLPELLARRRSVAELLRAQLATLEGVRGPVEPDGLGHVYQSFVTMLDPAVDRDALVARLRARGIETTLGTYALHEQPFFQERFGYSGGQLPASSSAFHQTLALPFYPQMDASDVDTVVESLAAVLREL